MLFIADEQFLYPNLWVGFPGSDIKESAFNEGDLGSKPDLGRSPEEGNGNPLQYSFLENPTGFQRVEHNWVIKTFTFNLSLKGYNFSMYPIKKNNRVTGKIFSLCFFPET